MASSVCLEERIIPTFYNGRLMDIQLTRIRMSFGGSRHEHITNVGSATQVWTREAVIGFIEQRSDTFYVRDSAGRRADVGVVNATPKYLRTYADGQWTDNLLALPHTA